MKETTPSLDTDYVRQQFPALTNNPVIFMDNAGGSQTLGLVINRIAEYLTHHDVQLGASYRTSAHASTVLDAAVSDIADLVGVSRPEQIILGPTSTMLLRILSLCLSENWQPGDEVIITDTDHEANVSCWLALENRGIRTRVWRVNQDSYCLETGDLQALLNDRTRLVSCCHVSNITGSIQPIREIAGVVHDAGALLAVDGVALAPHPCHRFRVTGCRFLCLQWLQGVWPPHRRDGRSV